VRPASGRTRTRRERLAVTARATGRWSRSSSRRWDLDRSPGQEAGAGTRAKGYSTRPTTRSTRVTGRRRKARPPWPERLRLGGRVVLGALEPFARESTLALDEELLASQLEEGLDLAVHRPAASLPSRLHWPWMIRPLRARPLYLRERVGALLLALDVHVRDIESLRLLHELVPLDLVESHGLSPPFPDSLSGSESLRSAD